MKDFQTRAQTKSNILYSWFFLCILLIILGLFVKSAYASFIKKNTANIQQQKYQERFEDLSQKKENLEEKIQNLKSERGKEEEFRKRFNVVKEGETMIRIINEKQ